MRRSDVLTVNGRRHLDDTLRIAAVVLVILVVDVAA
jgi:hypothetical protein